MLKWLERHPELRCKRIKRNGEQCKKAKAHHCSVCASHGAHKIRVERTAPNFKNGNYTKSVFETRKQLRMLTFIGNKLGFLKRKLRGRKILIQGEKI